MHTDCGMDCTDRVRIPAEARDSPRSSSWPVFRSKIFYTWVTILFPWGKSGRSVKLTTPPSSTGVTNASFYTATAPTCLMAWTEATFCKCIRTCIISFRLSFIPLFIYSFIYSSINPSIYSYVHTRCLCVFKCHVSWNFVSLFKHWNVGQIYWHVTLH